jgi:hypothetical protein
MLYLMRKDLSFSLLFLIVGVLSAVFCMNMLCCFDQQDVLAKLRLFLSYCNSSYGCELWPFYSNNIELFRTAWR